MNFRDLQGSLLDVVRRRVRNGQITERGLARLSGMSQPHIHNVLKNARTLSFESADRLMACLDIGIGELLGAPPATVHAGQNAPPDADEEFTFAAIPLLRARVGPGTQPVFNAFRGYIPVQRSLASELVDPVAARLAPDLVLPRPCAAGDIVLLDQSPARRARPQFGLWIVADDPFGMRVRYARVAGTRLNVFHEANFGDPATWDSRPLGGRNILDIVRARIVWISRKLEDEAPRPAGPAGPGH